MKQETILSGKKIYVEATEQLEWLGTARPRGWGGPEDSQWAPVEEDRVEKGSVGQVALESLVLGDGLGLRKEGFPVLGQLLL